MASLLRAFVQAPDASFLQTADETLTYGEVLARATALAHEFRTHAKPGDRVAVLAPPSAEVVITLFAAYLAGLIVVPINTRYRGAEIEHILFDSGAVIFVHAGGETLDAAGALPATVSTVLDLQQGVATRGDEPTRGQQLDPEAGGLIIYTSGTTGRSKGVLLSHGAIADNIHALTSLWRWTAEDTLSLALPLFHVHGLCIGIHGAALHGMRILLHERFDAAAIAADFADRGATVFMGVPTMYARLLEHLDVHPEAAADLAKGRLFTSGSAALSARDHQRFRDHTGHAILERYGMSETLITLSNPHDGERRPGSVGRAVPGCEVKVADEEGREVPPGETGEIFVRSNGIMTEYFGLAKATRQAFADGGWFRTGDVAVRSADGYVRIVGRKSVDIIKSGGFKISAREIEEVIGEVPGVKEVAVLGVADETWGEKIVAAVVRDGSVSGDELADRVVARVRVSLADYKTPREVIFVETLPRNALGKLQKHRLRQLFRGAELRPVGRIVP